MSEEGEAGCRLEIPCRNCPFAVIRGGKLFCNLTYGFAVETEKKAPPKEITLEKAEELSKEADKILELFESFKGE